MAPPTAPVMAPPPPLPSHLSAGAKPLLVAPPPLPSHLEPKKKLDPQPGQEEFYRRPDNWPGRGYLVRYVGEAIHKAQETPLNIRHDILIERRVIGRVLGKGGRDLEAMQLCSGTSRGLAGGGFTSGSTRLDLT